MGDDISLYEPFCFLAPITSKEYINKKRNLRILSVRDSYGIHNKNDTKLDGKFHHVLEELHIDSSLLNVDNLPTNVERLVLYNYFSKLPDITSMKRLKHLKIIGMNATKWNMSIINQLGLKSLFILNGGIVNKIEDTLDDLCNSNLRILSIGSDMIEIVPENVKYLHVDLNINRIPDLSNVVKLEFLQLSFRDYRVLMVFHNKGFFDQYSSILSLDIEDISRQQYRELRKLSKKYDYLKRLILTLHDRGYYKFDSKSCC